MGACELCSLCCRYVLILMHKRTNRFPPEILNTSIQYNLLAIGQPHSFLLPFPLILDFAAIILMALRFYACYSQASEQVIPLLLATKVLIRASGASFDGEALGASVCWRANAINHPRFGQKVALLALTRVASQPPTRELLIRPVNFIKYIYKYASERAGHQI